MTIPATVESEIRALLDGEKGDSLDLRRAIVEAIFAAEDRAFADGWAAARDAHTIAAMTDAEVHAELQSAGVDVDAVMKRAEAQIRVLLAKRTATRDTETP